MRTTLSLVAMMMVLGASLAGCGDDTGNSSGGGSDSEDTTSGNGNTTAAGNGNTTAAGNGNTTAAGGNTPQTCEAVCEYQPTATDAQADCVGADLQSKGYPVLTTDSCNSIDSIATCNECYVDIAVSDADCAATFAKCY